MKSVGSLAVGFAVSTLLLMLIAGGIEEAVAILALSIVCTAGIGLVVWIPLWWVVGWVTLTVVGSIRRMGQPPESSEEPAAAAVEAPASSEELSLLQFLKRAEARGASREKIDRALVGAGWSEAEILQARSKLDSSSAGVWI